MFQNMNPKPPMYDPKTVQFMRDELTFVGFEEMLTPEKVEKTLSQKNDETILVFINSVCGCAAGSARPGVSLALQNKVIPEKLTTVFAGQEIDAVDHVRKNYLNNYPPSSPSLAIIKNGSPIYMMQRHQIEGSTPEEVAFELIKAFNAYCSKSGPSIRKEKYDELIHAKICGSKIPIQNN